MNREDIDNSQVSYESMRRGRKERSLSIIQRTANDFNGRLGSLYNACHDRIAGTLNLNCDDPLEQFPSRTQCTLFKGDQHYRHPSQVIDLDEQLRLSLLLNLTPKNGLATILDHPYAMDPYTRILRYTYLYREEHFPDEQLTIREVAPMITSETDATHVIIGISWGIDIVTILQLPPNDRIAAQVDLTLEKYRSYLSGERNDFRRTREDIDALMSILGSQTYSNIVGLDRTIVLHDLFHQISRYKLDERNHQPLTYTLRSLPTLYRPFPAKNIATLEHFFLTISSSLTVLEIYFNENMQHLLCGHFKQRFANAYGQWLTIKQKYPLTLAQYAQLVFEIRSGHARTSHLEKRLRNKTDATMKTTIDALTWDVTDLNAKAHLISDLYHQRIRYRDARDYPITKQDDDESSLKRKLITDENLDRVLCSNDLLNKQNPTLFRQVRHDLVDQLANNDQLRLTYVDFSYCDYPLPATMVLPVETNHTRTNLRRRAPVKPPRVETLNILLLGDTSMEKSMFINALTNYLTFPTLNKLQSRQPIVEHINPSTNCQSYLYHLNERLKLRFIDTPGLSGGRDVDQDERTMQHIFQYIKKLTKLNAICCILKPNESPSNTFLRSYLTDLVNLLGSNLQKNLLFCTIDVRSNACQETNIFSFPSQAMAYLTILQNQVPITAREEQDYEVHWKNSVAESHRLIDYIHKQLRSYSIPNEEELIKHLRIKTVHLTHPMLETMRDILRNIVMNKMISLKQIEPSTNLDHHHNVYQHLPQRPVVLDFLHEYQMTDGSSNEKQQDMIDHLSLFCHISVELSDFLMSRAGYRNGDPFLIGLHRLIDEENELCEKHNRNYLNLQLVDALKKLARHYEQRIQTIQSNAKPTTLTNIDQWVRYIADYPLVSGYVISSIRTNQ